MWKVVALLSLAGCDYFLHIDQLSAPADASVPNADVVPPDALFVRLPYAHYTMNAIEGAVPGILHDVTGNHDGTCDMCPAEVIGHLEGALDFNIGTNTSTEVDIPHAAILDALDQYTIATWMAVFSFDDAGCPLSKQYGIADLNTWQLCVLAAGELVVYTEEGDHTLSTVTPVVTLGGWHHVAFVFDGSTKQLWFDGDLVASGPGSRPATDSHGITIGVDIDHNTMTGDPVQTAPFHGALDDIKLYSVALTQTEIRALASD